MSSLSFTSGENSSNSRKVMRIGEQIKDVASVEVEASDSFCEELNRVKSAPDFRVQTARFRRFFVDILVLCMRDKFLRVSAQRTVRKMCNTMNE